MKSGEVASWIKSNCIGRKLEVRSTKLKIQLKPSCIGLESTFISQNLKLENAKLKI